jgi:hypothetical protein
VSDSTDRAEYIAGLRALADVLERHPDLPLPSYGPRPTSRSVPPSCSAPLVWRWSWPPPRTRAGPTRRYAMRWPAGSRSWRRPGER